MGGVQAGTSKAVIDRSRNCNARWGPFGTLTHGPHPSHARCQFQKLAELEPTDDPLRIEPPARSRETVKRSDLAGWPNTVTAHLIPS